LVAYTVFTRATATPCSITRDTAVYRSCSSFIACTRTTACT
jgi:hypothetical protein